MDHSTTASSRRQNASVRSPEAFAVATGFLLWRSFGCPTVWSTPTASTTEFTASIAQSPPVTLMCQSWKCRLLSRCDRPSAPHGPHLQALRGSRTTSRKSHLEQIRVPLVQAHDDQSATDVPHG